MHWVAMFYTFFKIQNMSNLGKIVILYYQSRDSSGLRELKLIYDSMSSKHLSISIVLPVPSQEHGNKTNGARILTWSGASGPTSRSRR